MDGTASPRRGRFWRHLLALTAAVTAFVALGRPGVALYSDEGAAAIQAQLVRNTGSWTYVDPLAEVSRDGDLTPFVRGARGVDGDAPYAKHPLYPALLAGLGPSSTWAMLALSIAGTVTAAGAAARLARRCWPTRPGAELAVLWTVGLASPLLFDSALLLAHTASAALVTLALVPAVIEQRRWWHAPAVLLALVLAGMLRTEALFVGPAVAIACFATRGREGGRWLPIAIGAGLAAPVSWAVDRWWAGLIVPRPIPGPPNDTRGWLLDRVDGAWTTLLRPSYSDPSVADVLVWCGVGLVALGAMRWRRGGGTELLVFGAAVWSVGLLGRTMLGVRDPIPGLLMAFPVGVVALLLATRESGWPAAARRVAISAAIVVGAVLATQYGIGGGYEWGGRYFAIVVPALVAVLVPPALAQAGALASVDRRVLGATVGALAAVTILTALVVQRHGHERTAAVLDEIAVTADEVGSGAGSGRPVVVSENRLLPQIAYRDFDHYTWAVAPADVMSSIPSRLTAIGEQAFVLVTPSGDVVDDVVEGGGSIETRTTVGTYEVLVIRLPPNVSS